MKEKLKNIFYKLWYGYLSLIDKNADIIFMNYGYSKDNYKIELEETDEKNRYSIQLYHLVATGADIEGKDILEVGCGRGGARGTAHIGVIRELEKQGYEITSISATSMGALVGGVYAAGKLDEYEEWLRSLGKMDVFNLVDFTLSTNGIIKADRVLREIEKFIPDQKIEELPISYAAVVTDFKQKKEVVLTEGSLFEAIRGSISIPLVITPVLKSDTVFVDGGVLNPVPTNRVARQKDDILVAVDVNSRVPHQKLVVENPDVGYFEKLTNGKLSGFQKQLISFFPAQSQKKENTGVGYFNLISETSSLMLSQISKLTLEIAPPDILIEISRKAYGTFDFYRSKEIIETGRDSAIVALDNYKKSLL